MSTISTNVQAAQELMNRFAPSVQLSVTIHPIFNLRFSSKTVCEHALRRLSSEDRMWTTSLFRPGFGIAAALALGIAGTWQAAVTTQQSSATETIVQDAAASHLHSLMADAECLHPIPPQGASLCRVRTN